MINGRARRIGGNAMWFNGDGPNIERDSITCAHCNTVVFIEPLKPVEDVTGWCMGCMKFICPRCATKRECDPLEKKLARMEGRAG